MEHKIVNPSAAVIIWNYEERVDADGGDESTVHDIEEVIVGTASLVSIATSKQKSSPAGRFEFRLAPRINWVSRITPGSWCAILMSSYKIGAIDNQNLVKANGKTFKMLGRIDSVRGVVDVDQSTAARTTSYVVTGSDWGSVFDSKLYIDPILLNNMSSDSFSIGLAMTLLGTQQYEGWISDKTLPSSSDIVSAIVKLWGSPLADGTAALDAQLGTQTVSNGSNPSLQQGVTLTSHVQFQLPKQVATFMGKTVVSDTNFAELIKVYHGRLDSYDEYSGDAEESFGIPSPDHFFRMNSFWQLLVDNSNPILNELVTDIRWDKDGVKPQFALYHRIFPFLNREEFTGSTSSAVSKAKSLFKNVRRVKIPIVEVVSVNYGTNWRDKINFIELTPQPQLLPAALSSAVKIMGQTLDRASYERDGFKPMFFYAKYLPYDINSKQILVEPIAEWKHLLREWHFNTHLMLNGAITFIGQNRYIQVGDNIMVDARILGSSPMNAPAEYDTTEENIYLLAHVEGISHNFNVSQETGARSFTTTVHFVRGIISAQDGSIYSAGTSLVTGALDKQNSMIAPIDRRIDNVFGASTNNDPDTKKLTGN